MKILSNYLDGWFEIGIHVLRSCCYSCLKTSDYRMNYKQFKTL